MKEPSVLGLGGRLKYIRERRGLSIREVAMELGCRSDQYQNIEEGKAEEATTYVVQIWKAARLFGVGLDFVFEGAECALDGPSLFGQELHDVKMHVIATLEEIDPRVSITECKLVLAEVDRRFDLFKVEQIESMNAESRRNREGDCFRIDEFDVRRMLDAVRKRH